SEAVTAAGAANARGTTKYELLLDAKAEKKEFQKMPALTLKRSIYPSMTPPVLDKYNSEIIKNTRKSRQLSKTPPNSQNSPNSFKSFNSSNSCNSCNSLNSSNSCLFEGVEEIILGMDIGSTSTKLAVLDARTFEPVLDIYGRTAGDPVRAARNIFASFYNVLGDREIPVKAFGTTGSGRKLVGKIFGADLIVNEITAHGRGTVQFYPEVETIFEIGGQDAKYIRLQDGYVADVNMNYVCAAGTGSFVEEQARKLGFKVSEIGAVTAGIAPPVTSDRCTVFMEQDLRTLLKEGFTKEEALASVLYSVIRNYLTRVVGNRQVSSERIFFQGATARNKGLVAALENLLEVEVTVSPFCHLMGAIGAAVMAQEHCVQVNTKNTYSAFAGRKSIEMRVSSRTETCKLCRNFCRINYISRDTGPEFSWGYQCGRDPEEKIRKEVNRYSLFKQRDTLFYTRARARHSRENQIDRENPTRVTIANALSNHTYYPLWNRFFQLLGCDVRVSARHTDTAVKKYSASLASADFCFPVKTALGHVVKAMDDPGFVFLPDMIADKQILETAQSYFCPYMESSASIVRSTLTRGGMAIEKLITPVIDLRRSQKETASGLFNALQGKLNVKKKDVLAAFKKAFPEFEEGVSGMERSGSELLSKLKNSGEPVFLLIGRPYNLHDRGLNLGIPEKIASMGYRVIPIDMLDLKSEIESLAEGNYHNIFWKYGQRIIAALKSIAGTDNIFPIYLSNFNCGPDSFLLSFAEEEIKGKPMLILELDEHDSDGGYLTRIEAFTDVIKAYMKSNRVIEKPGIPQIYTVKRKADLQGTIWMSPMNHGGSRLLAAGFRAVGYKSESLPAEDQETFSLGKKYLKGGECLPMALTLGGFIKAVKNDKSGGRHILLMPSTEGPCRFGQYNLLQRIIFHDLGLKNVDILSPSSINSYQGVNEELRRLIMHGTICSDILVKLAAKIRPYERTKGDADELFERSLSRMEHVLESGGNTKKALTEITSQFASISRTNERKPLVGIVGEIYVRGNAFSNGDLIGAIERNGGEAWLSPVHEWLVYIAYMQTVAERNRFFNLVKRSEALMTNLYISKVEQGYYNAAGELLFDRHEPPIKEVVAAGTDYLPVEFEGEGILTVGRAVHFAKQGADMVVNVAPFGCMPGTLSGSILLEVKEKYDIPMVSLFYDGDIDSNDKVAALLKTITIKEENVFQEVGNIKNGFKSNKMVR
ncbi:MAG: hypothetical protein GY757_03905, partial [bacterium]|nr:hypothetical protein [bacterium]